MDWLSVGIHTLGMLDTTGDWKEDALNLIARMPRMMGCCSVSVMVVVKTSQKTTSMPTWCSALFGPLLSRMSTMRSWNKFSPHTLFSTWTTGAVIFRLHRKSHRIRPRHRLLVHCRGHERPPDRFTAVPISRVWNSFSASEPATPMRLRPSFGANSQLSVLCSGLATQSFGPKTQEQPFNLNSEKSSAQTMRISKSSEP